jgi:hypothetical protein
MHPAEHDFWICVVVIGTAAIVGFVWLTIAKILDERRTRRILNRK